MSGGPDADTFTWNPGDGSDIVDGDTGADHLVFNGSGASEVIGIAAVAARVQLTRDVASITMDIGTTEALSVIALGGNDSITVSSLAAATDLTTLLLSGDDGTDVITASAAGSHLASVTIQEVRGPTR
jgi:Ca2+-binding RTX toxin-like protein